MGKIRVLIAYQSRLARELVRTIISRQEDLEVVGEIQDEPGVLSAVEQNQADCLIIEQEKLDQRPAIRDAVLRRSPEIKILAVASGTEKSTLYWVTREIRSVPVETSEEGVLDALRGKV